MPKIIVIDDDIDILYNLLELLQLSGYDVIGAEDGDSGLDAILQHQPALIFCDVLMPESDGWAVLDAVRSNPHIGRTPFIFVTALADKHSRHLMQKSAADGFITKPFTMPEILTYVQNYIDRQ